ncbi:MAG: SAF domain-containing protein [Microbacteriaceae bacterium]
MAGGARRRHFWFDPRFAVGVGLIVLAVTGTVLVVVGADRRVEVVAAREAIMPGERIEAADLVVRRVAAPDARALYLGPEEAVDGLLATRVVGAGELVPRSAVGTAAGAEATTLVVAVSGSLPRAIEAGSSVDVWAAGVRDAAGGTVPPAVVSAGVTVAEVRSASGLVVDEGTEVELLVPRDDVAAVLEAQTADAAITVVPVAVPLGSPAGGG